MPSCQQLRRACVHALRAGLLLYHEFLFSSEPCFFLFVFFPQKRGRAEHAHVFFQRLDTLEAHTPVSIPSRHTHLLTHTCSFSVSCLTHTCSFSVSTPWWQPLRGACAHVFCCTTSLFFPQKHVLFSFLFLNFIFYRRVGTTRRVKNWDFSTRRPPLTGSQTV
jgi:hypothetical protein